MAASLPETVQTTQTILSDPAWLPLPEHWPGQVDLITWCQNMTPGVAAILVLVGVVYLVFGIYLFRALVTANAALFGAYIGAWIGQKLDATLPGLLVGLILAAALAWPLMKYAVAIMGAAYGGLLGAAVWQTVGLDPNFAWAGAAIGLVACGLLSFILFRGSIMMFTSLQGSVMLIFGLLGLIYKYQDIAPRVNESLSLRPFLLPMFILVPATIGLIYQQTQSGTWKVEDGVLTINSTMINGKPGKFDHAYTIEMLSATEFRARLHDPDFLFVERRIPKFEFPPCYLGV